MATNVPPDSPVRSGQSVSLISQVKHGERQNYNPEFWHVKFRGFSPSEGSNWIQDLRSISELCYQWLRPDLNSKEEILDQLVLEQFLICMPPEQQALVKESGVKSCKDLEKLLRDRKRHNWSIIYSQGQAHLLRHPSVGKAEAAEDKWGHTDFSQEHLSNESEESLNRGQASRELQNLSETEEPSTSQEEGILLGVIPERRQPDYLRPEMSPGSDSVPDLEEAEASVFVGQDPLPALGPAGSLGVKGAVQPQEDTVVDAVPSFTHILERDLALNRDLQSLSGFNLPTSQGVASYMGNTEDGLEAANPEPANPQPEKQVDSLAGQARFQCTECKKSFLYKSRFDLHQRSHTGERPFKCILCNKAFVQSSDLRVHQRVHTGEKPYMCEVCGMEFAHGSTLQGHSRVHTKEKPFVCKDCGQRFCHKGNLNVHFRIHCNLRPYVCKKCNKTFRQQGTWKRHMKTHLRKRKVSE
ncbi:zinc finger and SCAN domain-containing protein 5B isoform X1 [Mus musculus]|uniref:Zinc finger and SCAN domain containing 5B n=4 Tax=Mus musculus TaxID=10090 RepID=B2RTN3_MOUSE|nr:zinc finger and SCAN domain-containing protein 5B [Mus musculus]XP_006539636.1 zinc finger and SCAN domain-containing protein 5B isoform X1 [Mus musculus]AAI39443.1 Zinc finger and SCAN domain containing 5B [Mus musculus]AAI39457.1 Zinc finger and SCAN domain containing 5B [Mus musculus]|eukprot:NP_573467.2 zinc finger and SCAN domain-containing protein 5B [Mus musculus]